MKIKNIIPICVIILVLTTSCATILTSTKQRVTFKSNAEGKVYQNLTEIGETNKIIKIKRKDLVKLYTIKSEGYNDKAMELKIKSNPAFLINLPLCFFGIGLITSYLDVLNGANINGLSLIVGAGDRQSIPWAANLPPIAAASIENISIVSLI